jgi:hypothetical protein
MEKSKRKDEGGINYFIQNGILVLQMGFCWKGDRNLFFEKVQKKKEMIDFIKEATNEN